MTATWTADKGWHDTDDADIMDLVLWRDGGRIRFLPVAQMGTGCIECGTRNGELVDELPHQRATVLRCRDCGSAQAYPWIFGQG